MSIKARAKRKMRIRSKISGTVQRPRVSMFRSNKYFYTQVIDDENNVTLKSSKSKMNAKVEDIKAMGETIGKELKKDGILAAVFDRSGYTYHGKVAALAEGLRSVEIHI